MKRIPEPIYPKWKEGSFYNECSHPKVSASHIYFSLTRMELPVFIKWKYTVGNNGSRTYCWQCYKYGKHQDSNQNNSP